MTVGFTDLGQLEGWCVGGCVDGPIERVLAYVLISHEP